MKELSSVRRSVEQDQVASAVIGVLRMQIEDLEHEISEYVDLIELGLACTLAPAT